MGYFVLQLFVRRVAHLAAPTPALVEFPHRHLVVALSALVDQVGRQRQGLAQVVRALVVRVVARPRAVQGSPVLVVVYLAAAQVPAVLVAEVVQVVEVVRVVRVAVNAVPLRRNRAPDVVKISMRCCRRRSPVIRPAMLQSQRVSSSSSAGHLRKNSRQN